MGTERRIIPRPTGSQRGSQTSVVRRRREAVRRRRPGPVLQATKQLAGEANDEQGAGAFAQRRHRRTRHCIAYGADKPEVPERLAGLDAQALGSHGMVLLTRGKE